MLHEPSWLFAIAATLGAADEGPLIRPGHKSKPYRWRGLTYDNLVDSLMRCGISADEGEIAAVVFEVGRAKGRRRCMSPEYIGRLLDVLALERAECRLTSIEAIDETAEARRIRVARERRRRDRESKRAKRALTPRQQWLAASLSAERPWAKEGIGRRTWERQRAKKLLSPEAAASSSAAEDE